MSRCREPLNSAPTSIRFVHLEGLSIFQQLQLEEALLRADTSNWCLVNIGVPPAIVLGISGNPQFLVEETERSKQQIPLIRRFSGGGTVVVDENTCFVSFIFNHSSLDVPPFPMPIMQWTETFYRPLFTPLDFRLRENDYVIGERKCGGNAQSLIKNRWLHHSTFLWDYCSDRMNCLKIPLKMPNYRNARHHHDFVCKLKDYFFSSTAKQFLFSVYKQLTIYFQVEKTDLTELTSIQALPHRKSTQYLTQNDNYSCNQLFS